MRILWIIVFSLLGSVGAIITAAAFLLLKEKNQKILITCLISYATGTLLTAALLGLIPHALKHNPSPPQILSTVLAGIISSLSTISGAIIAYYALEVIHAAIPYVMAVSAASFLYIALADLTGTTS